MGYGKRSDFTMANVEDKGDFLYNHEKMGSFKEELERLKAKGTRKGSTMGTPYQKYERSIVTTNLSHYLGAGTQNMNGLG